MADEKSSVLGIRLDIEERKKFDEFVASEGKNNKEFLSTLLNIYELNKGKTKNINLVGDIEELEGYTNKIQKVFINIIDKLENQKEGIAENSQKDLQIYKDKVNSLIIDNERLTLVNSTIDDKLTNVNNIMLTIEEQNKSLNESLKDKIDLIEGYKGKNDMLLSDLAEYKGFKTKVEQYKGLLADAQAKSIEKDNSIKEKDFAISGLDKNLKTKENDINNLKLKNEEDLKQVNNKYIAELEQQKKENQLNIKLAVAEVKEDLNNKLNQEQLKHNADIQEYQNKYKMLLEQLEKERSSRKEPVNNKR